MEIESAVTDSSLKVQSFLISFLIRSCQRGSVPFGSEFFNIALPIYIACEAHLSLSMVRCGSAPVSMHKEALLKNYLKV